MESKLENPLGASMYSQVILDRIAQPTYNRLPNQCSQVGIRKNKCGDSVKIGLNIVENRIMDIGYTHSGCALSLGCTDYACSKVHRLSTNEARTKIYRILEDLPTGYYENGELILSVQPHRTDCVVSVFLLLLTLMNPKDLGSKDLIKEKNHD